MTRRHKLWLLSLLPVAFLLAFAILIFSSWGLSLTLRVASNNLPGKLTVDSHQGSLVGPISLRNVHYQYKGLSVVLGQLKLDWHSLALLSGRISITDISVDDVVVKVMSTPAKKASAADFNFLLPVAVDVGKASIDNLLVDYGTENMPVQISHLGFSVHAQGSKVEIRHFDVDAYQSQISISGSLGLKKQLPMELMLKSNLSVPDRKSLQTQGSIHGDIQNLRISQNLTGFMQAKLDGTVNGLLKKLNWQAHIELHQFDLKELVDKSPSTNVQGKINASGDINELKLDSKLSLNSKQIGLLEVNTTGNSDLKFEHYQFRSQGQFTGVELPIASFSAEAEGNHSQLQLTQVRIDTLKGTIQGDTQVGWKPGLKLDANLKLHQLHTGEFSSEWPGQLSGELLFHTTSPKSPIRFELSKVRGELRGYPLQALAGGSWSQDKIMLDKLQMDLGGTHVQAKGHLAQKWDLTLKAHGDNLNTLLPQAKGSFNLQGHVSGDAQSPDVTLQAEASQLAYANNDIKSLTLQLNLGLGKKAPAQMDLQINSLRGQVGQWNKVHLQMTGNNAAHTVSLLAENKTTAVRLSGHGKFVPWRWRGQMDTLLFQRGDSGEWQLQKTVVMDFAYDKYTVSPLCLIQNESQLCMDANWHDSQRKISVHAVAFPLSVFNPWLPSAVQLKGQIDVKANLQMTSTNKLVGQFSLRSPDKSMAIHFADVKQPVVLGSTALTAKLDNKGLHANLHLPFAVGGGIDSDVSLPGWSPISNTLGAQKIHGSVIIDKLPAEIATRFIPDLARAQGMLHANLQINGSLTEPNLRGEAQWQEGTVLIPTLGIQVRNVRLVLKSGKTNTVAFVLNAESGGGDLRVEGKTKLDPDQGWPTSAILTSHHLEISNIPEAYILVDSNIDLSMQGSTIHITGDVTVPKANLRPKRLPEGAVPLSSDVVIVSENKTQKKPQRWLISTRLSVKLGDEVLFNGFGIRGKLRGQVVLSDEPGKLVLAQGEIGIVDGVYRLRGQDLSIRRGRLMFSNTFIDDPALDVEAIRTIGTITAGVRLKGTLKQPKLSVFSEPTMSESDALAYLIVGRSMAQSTSSEGRSVSNSASALGLVAGDYLSQEIGGRLGLDELRLEVEQSTQNTALVMGKYLSPNLYVRYISGIAESSNIVQLQYQLSRRVQIQTEGGYRGSQSVSGGDIYFTIEY